MAGFGFDPSIILASTNADPGEGARTLATMLNAGMQRRLQQQSLAQMLQNQQFAAQDQPYKLQQLAAQAQSQDMENQATQAKLEQLHRSLLLNQAAAIKTPKDYATFLARVSPEGRAALGLPDQFDADSIKSLVAGTMPADKQAEYAETVRRQSQLADPNSPTSLARVALAKQFGLNVQPGTAGNAIDDQELNYGEKAMAAKESAAARMMTARMMAGYGPGGGGGGTPGPNQLDPLVEQTALTGMLPPGVSKQPGRLNQFMARLNQLHPGIDLASAKANYDANKASLDKQQGQSDAVNSFVRTFDKNVNMLESTLGDLRSSNNPFANKTMRYIEEHVDADPKYSAFVNSLNTVRSELGKINSGSTGQGGVPISVLEEMEKGLPSNATPAQVLSAIKVYRQDSENRRAAMSEQLGEIRDRMSGKKTAPTIDLSQPAAGGSSKQLIGYRYNGDHSLRKPVYADRSEGPPEPVNGK